MDTRELALLRKQTTQFINEDPTAITLQRDERVDDGAGGFTTKPGQPIAEQTFRMVPVTQQATASQTVDSSVIRPLFILIGLWDADVQVGDMFTLDSRDYRIKYVKLRTSQAYETWAEVEYRG